MLLRAPQTTRLLLNSCPVLRKTNWLFAYIVSQSYNEEVAGKESDSQIICLCAMNPFCLVFFTHTTNCLKLRTPSYIDKQQILIIYLHC